MKGFFKKTLSGFLAVLIATGNFSGVLPVIKAEAMTAKDGPTFEFVDSGEDKTQDAIIEGNISKFKVNSKHGYQIQTDAFEIQDKEYKPVTDSHIKIKDGNMTYPKIETSTGLLGNLDAKQFVIRGKFNVLQAKSDFVREIYKPKDGVERNVKTEATLGGGEAVTQNSHILFECTASEIGGTPPAFKVVEADGIFAGADKNPVTVKKIVQNKEYSLTVTPDSADATTSSSKEIHIFPTLVHTLEREVEVTKPDGGTETKTEQYDTKDIQVGTKFDVKFEIHKTVPLMLTVVSPQKSVDELAESIQHKETRDEFIKYGKNSQAEHVIEDFTLITSTKRYRTIHDIRWESEVVDSTGRPLGETDPTYNKNNLNDPRNKVAFIREIKDQSSGQNIDVHINPLEDDTYVKLTAYVKLKLGENIIKENQASFIINVKGTGTRPSFYNIKDFYKVDYSKAEPMPVEKWSIEDSRIDDNFPKVLGLNNGLSKAVDFRLEDGKPNNLPHKFGLYLKMGQKNSSSAYVKIQSSNPNVLEARVFDKPNNASSSQLYKYGSEIKNMADSIFEEGKTVVGFTPKQAGSTMLTIEFHGKSSYGGGDYIIYQKNLPIQVVDNSPATDAALSMLKIVKNDKTVLEYGFSPEKTEYEIKVPHAISRVSFEPKKRNKDAKKEIDCVITTSELINQDGGTKNEVIYNDVIKSGSHFDLPKDIPDSGFIDARFTVTAQSEDKITYKVVIIREPPSDDATLKSLKVKDPLRGTEFKLKPNFQRETYNYDLVVPYKVRELSITPEANHPYVQSITVDYTEDGNLVKDAPLKQTYFLDKEKFGVIPGKENKFVFNITPENGKYDYYGRQYTLNVYREPPSEDASSKDIKLTDYKTQKDIAFTPKFGKELFEYETSVPFETEKVKFKVTTSFAGAEKIEIIDNGVKNNITPRPEETPKVLQTYDYKEIEKNKGIIDTKSIDVKAIEKEGDFHRFVVKITAENGKATQDYNFDIYREPPETDADLKSLVIKGDEGINHEVIEYDFFTDVLKYDITVPYETKSITLTPTVASETASAIEIKASTRVLTIKAENGKETAPIKLEKPTDDAGNTLITEITVKVIAQDRKTEKVYNYNINRAAPNSDASLIKLEVEGTEPLEPMFKPSEHSYTALAKKDITQVTVKATPNNPNSIMWLGKDKLEPGQPSKPIDILEDQVEIVIDVTAQDGKSKEKYIVNITNLNNKLQSNNADLESLTINYGDMRPKFSPSITNYNVAVSSETDSVQFIPRAADKYAKVEVFRGSKQIGDENGRFFDSIDIGENNFSVKVTSPSTNKVKVYNIAVNRDVEDKQASFKPVTPEQINWETEDNIIVVSVEEYPVITSEVFIKMRDEYPEKTLVLQGNDYSFQFRGKDLSKNIPHRVLYDFKLLFETPEEERIEELLYDIGDNKNLDKVYMYFRYHGPLPGPCVFNVSIGNYYGGKKLYMNYFNDERDRIDYYGYVRTNQKGNFSVRLDHFSTYMLTNRKVDGAEDRSGTAQGGYNSSVAVGAPIVIPSTNKVHPNTGETR